MNQSDHAEEVQACERTIEVAARAGDLVGSSGWELFQEHCAANIDACAKVALVAEDFNQVIKQRARAEVFQQMSCWLDCAMEAGREAESRLSAFVQPNLR